MEWSFSSQFIIGAQVFNITLKNSICIHLLKCGSLTVAFKSTILCNARSCYLTGSILLPNQDKHVKSLLFKVKYKLFGNTHYVAWSYLCRNTTSTSTSSRSSWRKSLRKCDTDSYVMCPHTTMCLKQSHTHTNIHKLELNYISVSSKLFTVLRCSRLSLDMHLITHHATCVSTGMLPRNICSICQLYLCNNAKNLYKFPLSNAFHDIKIWCAHLSLPENLAKNFKHYEFSTLNNEHFWSSN